MSIIKRPAEIIGKETIAALIYGQSGMGKTTLACSAPSPVLFDFDGGVARLRNEHQVPTVQIAKWQDALDALKELEGDGGEFKTVIVDTASKMIDAIIVDVCGTAQPKLQQWGMINAKFKSFLRGVQSLGKNIVFICQREVEKNGEDTRYVPQFRASNYKDVICDLDVCGYMEMVTEKGRSVRKLTFNPTERNEGKNTAEFAPFYFLPELGSGTANTFLTDRFTEYVAKQRERNSERATTAKAVAGAMETLEAELAACDDAMSLNSIVTACKKQKPVGDLRVRQGAAVAKRAKELGLKLNKESKLYE